MEFQEPFLVIFLCKKPPKNFKLSWKNQKKFSSSPLPTQLMIKLPPLLPFAFSWKKNKKKASYYLHHPIPNRLAFLPQPNNQTKSLNGLRDFVLIFKTKKNKIISVKNYEKDDSLIIRITPEKDSIDPRDFSFIPADFVYDLLIIVGASSLDSLGEIYAQNTDMFFEVPKVNIDNHSANENYGQVNLVDITSPALSEIVFENLEKIDSSAINSEIAQLLLCGIISATESFQKPTTTPHCMINAAKLMKYKADQPTIIQNLYRTKSLSFLKLWGRMMARLNWNEEEKLAWSLLSVEDFVQSRSTHKDIPFVIDEIQKNFAQAQIIAVFFGKTNHDSLARVRVTNEKKAEFITQAFGLPLEKEFEISFEGKNLLEAEKHFLEKIKEALH